MCGCCSVRSPINGRLVSSMGRLNLRCAGGQGLGSHLGTTLSDPILNGTRTIVAATASGAGGAGWPLVRCRLIPSLWHQSWKSRQRKTPPFSVRGGCGIHSRWRMEVSWMASLREPLQGKVAALVCEGLSTGVRCRTAAPQLNGQRRRDSFPPERGGLGGKALESVAELRPPS
jgi:hypothetical protein